MLARDPACGDPAAGTVTCDLLALPPRGAATVQLFVRAPARCAGRVPTPIANAATVANVAEFTGADPDPNDDLAASETAVVDATPPALADPAIVKTAIRIAR